MKQDVIIACDFQGMKETLEFLSRFGETRPFVKIGMELFYAEGPPVVRALKARGHRVFLDLKLHDIPNTVRKAMKSLSALDIDLCNVHASGTIDMMKAAREGLTRPDGSKPLLIAVTQLTSTNERQMQQELLISAAMDETVIHYAKNTKTAGLDGIVCSPVEAAAVKEACGQDFLTITPGIRFHDAKADDQARVTTPLQARKGSDFIVVGRPITAANDPLAAYERCVDEFIKGIG